MDKSPQNFELLKKGSVLFVDPSLKKSLLKYITEGSKIKIEIKDDKIEIGSDNTAAAFHQIGYNYAI